MRDMNTSSRDGRRRRQPRCCHPAQRQGRVRPPPVPASPARRLGPGRGALRCPRPAPPRRGRTRPRQRPAAWLRSVTENSTTSPPMRSFSSSDVPDAITSPWSMTTMSSASSSASSRYCVQSKRVVPPATSSRIIAHIPTRLRGSRPGRGFVQEKDPRLADKARGQVEAP